MARIKKPLEKNETMRIEGDRQSAEGNSTVLLVGRGRHAYLWIKAPWAPKVVTVSGATVLRKLAKAILAEVGEE